MLINKSYLIIIILTLLGGFLRLVDLGKNPVSLNVDEVSVGYNAYSILKTGRDENGYFLPLSFKSLGDYKPPLYIYLTVPSVWFFGLNEFAIRFPAALIGTLSIPLFYLFYKLLISNNKIALIGAGMLAISPWQIYHSRFALESVPSVALVIGGSLLFMMMIKNGGWKKSIISAILLILAMFTYQTERLFVPMLILFFIFFYHHVLLKSRRREFIAFAIIALALSLPLMISIYFGPDKTRSVMLFFNKDVDLIRNVYTPMIQYQTGINNLINIAGNKDSLLLIYWTKRILIYLNPAFWFFNGLGMTGANTIGIGLLYIFEIPLVILGVINLIRKTYQNKLLIFYWLMIGLIPASLTLGDPNPRRILIISPIVILVSAIGVLVVVKWLLRIKNKLWKVVLTFGSISFATYCLASAYLMYTIHFPRQKGEGLMDGTKEATEYILNNQQNYREVVFDPVRGVDGPFIVNVPHLYILFYSKYDPFGYQNINKRIDGDSFGFDKYTVRKIDWRVDRIKKGTLFIGSPWSLPMQDLKEDEILKKIYMTNGQLAYIIVSPK